MYIFEHDGNVFVPSQVSKEELNQWVVTSKKMVYIKFSN